MYKRPNQRIVESVAPDNQTKDLVRDHDAAINDIVVAIRNLQEYAEEKYGHDQRLVRYLADIYQILGLDPGTRFDTDESMADVIRLLLTDVADHTVRVGRLEQLMEQVLAQLSKLSPPPQHGAPEKIVEVKHELDNSRLSTHRTTDNGQQPTANSQRHVVLTEEVCLILIRNYGKRDNTGRKITLDD